MHRAILAAVLVTLTAASATGGELSRKLTQESALEQVAERGKLRVGFSTFVPWAMKDKTGEFIGFEIDVARRLAEDMGVEVEFVPTKWDGIIPALLTGKFDVIIGGMGIRPQRNLKVNFTIPYDYTGMSIMAHRKKAEGFDSLEDFNTGGVAIAARMGTTAAAAAKKHMPEAELRLFDDEAQTIQELMNGRVHAVVASAPLPAHTVARFPGKLFLPLEETFTREAVGFAIRKGDVDTLNFFNNWIRVVANEGWLEERHDYWFRTRDWEDRIK
jgi:polar amino acid transport system substrate-binding protein